MTKYFIRYYKEIFEKINEDYPFAIRINQDLYEISEDDLIKLLEKDKVDIQHIDSIRYYDPNHSGYLTFPKFGKLSLSTLIEGKLFTIILKMKPNIFDKRNAELLIKHLDNKLIEIENQSKIVNQYKGKTEAPHLEKFISSNDNEKYIQNEMDFVFLFSNPIEEEPNIFVKDYPLDFDKELINLKNILSECGKKLTLEIEIANSMTLKSILKKKPKILHISCHGQNSSEFSLKFENNGRLEKLTKPLLEEILKENHDIKLVYISACYSENAGKIFSESGVPAVICVQSDSQILDEAAESFNTYFYKQLLEGETIKNSYEFAIRIINARFSLHKNTNCCCRHKHRHECQWKDDHCYEFHNKNCRCQFLESHIHKKINCSWRENFINIFNPKIENYDEISDKICCCSPDLPHAEFKKFVIKFNGNNGEERIFENLQKGNLELTNKFTFFNLKLSVDMTKNIIGRKKNLIDVMDFFSKNVNDRTKNRMVTIYGKHGLCKREFVKLVGRYMYERKFFMDGVIYIENKNLDKKKIINQILNDLGDLNVNRSENKFFNIISKLNILIIFYCRPIEKKSEFSNFLKDLIDKTKLPKILVATDDTHIYLNINNNEDNKLIELKKLEKSDAVNLLKMIISNLNIGFSFYDCDYENLVKEANFLPSLLYKLGVFLTSGKINKKDDLYSFIKKVNSLSDTMTENLSYMYMKNKQQEDTLFQEILFYLLNCPYGLSKEFISSVFVNNFDRVLKNLEEMSIFMITIKNHLKFFKSFSFSLNSKEIKSTIENFLRNDTEFKKKESIFFNKLLSYQVNLLRKIVFKLYQNNEQVIEFSAASNYGIWCSLELLSNEEEYAENSNTAKILKNKIIFFDDDYKNIDPEETFNTEEDNIFYFFNFQNFNNRKFNEIRENFESLTILIPTALKFLRKYEECLYQINKIIEVCRQLNYNNTTHVIGRLLIFSLSLFNKFKQLKLGDLEYKDKIKIVHSDYEFCSKLFKFIYEYLNEFKQGQAELLLCYEIVKKECGENSKNSKNNLNEALNLYKLCKDELGIARINFVKSDFKFFTNKNEIIENYNNSKYIFDYYRKYSLSTICFIKIINLYLDLGELTLAKKHIDQATKLISKHKITYLQEILKDLKENLNRQLRKITNNAIVFLKAHQLVKTIGHMYVPVNNLVAYPSNFKVEIIENFNKKVNVIFDYLTKNKFIEIIDNGSRFLHISSEEYNDKGSLFVEGENGESIEIKSEEIKKILIERRMSLRFEIVILSIPQSSKLAEIIKHLGPKNLYVIYFHLEEKIIIKIQNYLRFDFLGTLYKFSGNILKYFSNGETIENSYRIAHKEFMSNFGILNDRLDNDELKSLDYCCQILIPIEDFSEYFSNFFNHKSKNELIINEGELNDLSIIRPNLIKIEKRIFPYIGRKIEMFNTIKCLKKYKDVVIYGEPGIGLTSFLKEVGYYINVRNIFKDGIYYIDLNESCSTDDFKILFKFYEIEKLIQNKESKMLIIFDNCDKIIRFNNVQFKLFLDSFKPSDNKDDKSIVFMISFSNYNNLNKDLVMNIYSETYKYLLNENVHIELKELPEDESILLFYNYHKDNNLDLYDLYNKKSFHQDDNIQDIIKKSSNKPKLLKESAIKHFKKKPINIERFNPQKRKSSIDSLINFDKKQSKTELNLNENCLIEQELPYFKNPRKTLSSNFSISLGKGEIQSKLIKKSSKEIENENISKNINN